MNIGSLLLKIKDVDLDSLICQKNIQTKEDKKVFSDKGYQANLTESEFKEHFKLDPSCIWYLPSVSPTCLYFNKETFAAAPFYPDFLISGVFSDIDRFYKVIERREEEAANNDFIDSALSLPDGMRMQYFERLIENKGTGIPDMYHQFFSVYKESDYGFGHICPSTLSAVVNTKTFRDQILTQLKLKRLSEVIKVYRGGNTASTPFDQAFSWTLDINVANFFACRLGHGNGYIVEGEVAKEDIIDAFLDDRSEQEIIVEPQNVNILNKISIKGLEDVAVTFPETAPMYHKYLNMLDDLDFAQDSEAHGREHEARVMLLALTIAHFLGLPVSDQKVLCTAAIYHDTQRVNDVDDSVHGRNGREYYHATVERPDPLVEFLCEYHCLPDETGYQEIKNNRKLSKNRTKAKLLYDIFKDADALDRVRFGIRELDMNYLRLPVSKELTLAARLYQEYVQVPEKPKTKNPALSDRIRSASVRTAQPRHCSNSKDKKQEPEL